MENPDDNVTLQSEELEALSSIYAEDFTLDEEDPPTFTVSIPLNNGAKEASLMITFETDYPTAAPPMYQLSIPWIRGGRKKEICATLEQLYMEHIGESIVYIWVEKLRELLEQEQEGGLEEPFDKEKNPISDQLIASSGLILNNNQTSLDRITSTQSFKVGISQKRNMEGGCRPESGSIQISTGDPFTDRKSTFQAHIAAIHDVFQVRVVLDELYKNKKIATATHNMYAYRIFKEDTSTWLQDCDDNGETHAGSRLLHLIQILGCRNVIVVVTRWYGGIQLHGDRFKFINNVARQALELNGFIVNAKEKKK